MVARLIKGLITDPERVMMNGMLFQSSLASPEWIKSHPITAGVFYGAPVLAAGGLVVSALADRNNENEALQNAANVVNWGLNPALDTAQEYITNREFLGIGQRKSAALAGGSGAGMFAGQLLGQRLFRDEEGESSNLAIALGGLAGDFVGDLATEAIYDRAPSILSRVLKRPLPPGVPF